MPVTEPARPRIAAFIHLPRPTADRMRLLKDALVYLKTDLTHCLEFVDNRHSDVEDWLNLSEVFAELSKLIFDFEQAMHRGAVVLDVDEEGEPAPAADPFNLPLLGTIDFDAPPKAKQKKANFNVPRYADGVECGC